MSIFLTPDTDTGLQLTWAELERKYLTACHAVRVWRELHIGHKPMPGLWRNIDERRRQRCVRNEVRPIKTDCGRRFKSIANAARKLGVSPQSISVSILRGGTCAGFRWSYIEKRSEAVA